MRAWLRENWDYVMFALGLLVVMTVVMYILFRHVFPLPRGGA